MPLVYIDIISLEHNTCSNIHQHYIPTQMYTTTQAPTHTHTHMHARTHARTHAHTHNNARTTHTHTHTYIYIYIYIYIYTYIYWGVRCICAAAASCVAVLRVEIEAYQSAILDQVYPWVRAWRSNLNKPTESRYATTHLMSIGLVIFALSVTISKIIMYELLKTNQLIPWLWPSKIMSRSWSAI